MIRFILSLTIAAILAPALPARADDAQDVRSVTALRLLGAMAGFVTEWCDTRLPEDRARHARALADWRRGEQLDQIDALFAEMAGPAAAELEAAFAGGRGPLFEKLEAEYPEPSTVCQDLPSFLAQNFGLRRTLPDDAWRVAKLLDAAPQTPTGDTVTRLQAIGAKPPLSRGGQLTSAAFQCVQRRDFGRDVVSTYAYRLSLYEDSGLRVDQVTIAGSDGQENVGRDFIGTYDYAAETGEITATAWDTDNEDLDDFAMFAGQYDSVVEERLLVNTFHLITDAAGKAFIFGKQEYADQSSTLCVGLGAPVAQSPVAEADAKRAKELAERDRFRTAPGQGLQSDQIAGFLYDSDLVLEGGGGTHIDERVSLLLADGWGYQGPDYTPHDLDAAASQAGEPERWFQWRAAAGGIEVLGADGTWTMAKGFMADPATPQALTGSYSVQQAFGVSPATVATFATTVVTFGADGRFSWFTSRQAGAFASSETAEGSYVLDGYTLELRYDDGRIERPYVLLWGDGNLVIGGQTYSR